VSKNTALIVLYCFANQLTSLDTYSNRVLKSLYCHDNPGNGYLFPVRSWFEYDRVPSDFTTENWWYDGNTILIAYGQVLVAIDPGIEFNGVIWATRNVGGSFRFVDDPKDPGAYMSYWSGGCPPGWRVPTAKEWTALIDASYIIVDGGATFGDPTNPVFLPAGGHEHGTTVYGKGNEGWYWTSDATIAGLYISFNRSAHTASYPWPNAGGTPAHSNSTGLNVRCVRR
jgi:hypothetical protein